MADAPNATVARSWRASSTYKRTNVSAMISPQSKVRPRQPKKIIGHEQKDLRQPLHIDPWLPKSCVRKNVVSRKCMVGQYPFSCCDVPVCVWIAQESSFKLKNRSKKYHHASDVHIGQACAAREALIALVPRPRTKSFCPTYDLQPCARTLESLQGLDSGRQNYAHTTIAPRRRGDQR